MRLQNIHKLKSIYQRLLRYTAEVIIIFLGITISFFFEQWREEQRQKQQLIELAESLLRDAEVGKAHLESDLGGTEIWIKNLDSLRIQRADGKFARKQLQFFYNLLVGTTFGLFDSKSPAYLAAINNGMLSKLPDSIQLKMYNIYEAKLPDFQFLYNLQLETAKSFRNETMIPSEVYFYHTNSADVDWAKFAKEIQRPAYGNVINQMIAAEKVVRGRNVRLTEEFAEVIKLLQRYISQLKA